MNEDISAIQSEPLDEPADTVSVSFKSITFSDGTTIELDPTDIVVLVGPNNAGKSAALRELSDVFARNRQSTVLPSYEPMTIGTKQDFEQYVKKHAQIRLSNGMWSVSGYKLNQVARSLDLENFWPHNLGSFKSLFCLEMLTETRIKDSDPPAAINIGEEPTTHPIHLLIDDDTLELKVSDYFYRAFQSDLILDRTVAKTVSLSVILHLLAPTSASILLLDEPEAFLHPPQALRLLVHALGGDWSIIQPVAKIVRTAVEASKPSLNINQIKEKIREILTQELPGRDPQKHLSSSIDAVFSHSSPWETLKQNGKSALPQGHATQRFQELIGLCQEIGLWVLPVGEMEGFCRSIGGHGPSWVQQVIEERNLETDLELADVRQFVHDLWERRLPDRANKASES